MKTIERVVNECKKIYWFIPFMFRVLIPVLIKYARSKPCEFCCGTGKRAKFVPGNPSRNLDDSSPGKLVIIACKYCCGSGDETVKIRGFSDLFKAKRGGDDGYFLDYISSASFFIFRRDTGRHCFLRQTADGDSAAQRNLQRV